jgi:CRP-like cAMP-binding protein
MGATSEDTIALLRRVPVFAALAEDDLTRVAEVAVPRRFDAGETVFREGDESNTCYVVRSGMARAVREHSDGRSITLANFGPGDIFGELAMFDNERRSATVEAVAPTEVIAILGGDMRRLLREHPDIAVKLLAALGRRRAGRADHLDAGGPGAAGRILARVRQPVPGRAGAGGDHLPGPGPAHRARSRRARALCLLSSPPAASSCATARWR